MVTEEWSNNKLVQRIEDFGDGTGIKTKYDEAGVVISTENLTGLEIFPEESVIEEPPIVPEPMWFDLSTQMLTTFMAASENATTVEELKQAMIAAIESLRPVS